MEVAINAQLVAFGATYRSAGVSRYTYALLDGLSHAGRADQRYTVFIGAHERDAVKASPLRASDRLRFVASRWPTARPAGRILWEQLALPGALRHERAEVFHSPVNVLPRRTPCATVVTIHDLAFLKYPEHLRPTRRYYQRFFTTDSVRRATRIVAVSESTKRDLTALLGVPAERVAVIYTAIDADFRPVDDPATLAAFRARHGLPERYILYLGTLEPRKNIEGLIEAYARLVARDPDAPQLVLAGAKGWYFQAHFERVRALDMGRRITFAGFVSREEQPLWYAGADLFVYPSFYEGFGLPVAEALACGTPVITSNVSSLPEAGGPNATLVDPHDRDALAYAMRRSLEWAGQRESRARTRIEGPQWTAQFTVARMAQAYQDVYDEARRFYTDAHTRVR